MKDESLEKILEGLNNIIDGRLQDITEQLVKIDSTLSKTNLYLHKIETSGDHVSDAIDEMEEKITSSLGRTNFIINHLEKSVGILCSVFEIKAKKDNQCHT